MTDIDELAVLPTCTEQVKILHEDAAFLIVEKPARLLSVPGRNPLNRDSVIRRLQEKFPDAAIVHRLDFDTSGIMVIPMGKAALSHISKQFQARSIYKSYTAIVAGLLDQDEGTIDLPIAADMENRPKYKISAEDGKKSVTEFRVLARDPEAQTTRLHLHPITGRSHQLRLHLQAIGHPILGCEFYADEVTLAKASRLLLHATELGFEHPVSGQQVRFVCEPDF